MFKTLANAWKVPELRKKILYTVLLLAIFRFGAYIAAPGVNVVALAQYMESQTNALTSLFTTITGGAFSQLSIFAMSISPYITASIIIQLLQYAIPSLERLSKEGEAGKKKISRYMKYTSVILAAIEAFGLYLTYRGQAVEVNGVVQGIFLGEGIMVPLMFILTLTAGSTFLMWVGDQITNKGIGNGISLLIFAGIISGLPQAAFYLYDLTMPAGVFSITGLLISIAIIIGAVVLIAGVVWVTEAERRVPVQYAKRVVGRKMYGGQNTHIPIKLAMAGVLPVIFAMSLMQVPAMIMQLVNPAIATGSGFWTNLYYVFTFSSLAGSAEMSGWMIVYGIIHIVLYLILIYGFTFFYTQLIFNPIEVANNLKKNGGFIPGIRAGQPTSEYLSDILKYINKFGALFLGVIAVLPILTQFAGLSISFGGTAILIVVGVALESIKQLESQMLTRHYKGFLE